MNQIKSWVFLLTLSIALSNDGEGYRFIGNSTQDFYLDIESVFQISVGPWDFLTNFSGRQTYEFIAPKEKGDDIIYKMGWSKVIATDRIDDKVEPNHEAQKQNGTSYTIKNDPITGKQISLVGNDEESIQMLETAAGSDVGSLFSGEANNLLYPLGPDSIRYVGDVWTIENAAEKAENVFGWEDFEGTTTSKITYTFKKVKEKKGNKIAYIKLKNILELHGVGGRDDKAIEMTVSTEVDGDIRFNITPGLIERCKMSTVITGAGRSLEDDSVEKFNMAMSAKVKQKLK